MQPPELQPLPQSGPAAESGASLRHSLRLIMAAWFFGAIWMYITTGPVLTRFAQSLELPVFAYGLMAALPFAGVLIQLPTSYVIERFGGQKKLFIASGVIHRGIWALVALIPWMLPQAWWWPGLLGLLFLTAAVGHVSNPIWYVWMADLVPVRIRGRYFARRSQLGQLVGLAVLFFVGWILDRASAQGAEALRRALSLCLLAAGAIGMLDFVSFLGVTGPRRHKPDPGLRLRDMIRQPLADRDFRLFIGYAATMTFAVGSVVQFIWLYLFDVAGLSNTRATILMGMMPLAIMLFTYPVWGRLIDRFGRKPVQVIAGLLVVNGATGWIFIASDGWLWGYLLVVLANVAWPGYELANFNTLLVMSMARSGRRFGAAYIAVANGIMALAGLLSGIAGGWAAEWLKDWRGALFGFPLTYHCLLFAASGLLRLAAVFWLTGMKDRGAHSTRDTWRYITATLYTSAFQAALMPLRAARHVGRMTFKLNPVRRGAAPRR